jgi:hypothetical protein
VTTGREADDPNALRIDAPTNAVTPVVVNQFATSLPSFSIERCWYPPPGKTTTAVPLTMPAGGKYGVIVGWSSGAVPIAPGGPAVQSGIAG